MEWYDDLPHIGYDLEGKKVMRQERSDELDKFLANADDPDAWYVIFPFTLPLS
jgi:ribosome biogenesis protein ERB1